MPDRNTLSLFRIISHATSERLLHFNEARMSTDLFDELALKFETTVPALAQMSYEMEQRALQDGAAGGTIYVGFQKLSRFTPSVAERYLRMAEENQVYVFGLPDRPEYPHHPNLHYVELNAEEALLQEWFLVIDSPQYRAALSALDLVGFDGSPIEERLFTGVQSHAPNVAQELSRVLAQIV